MWRDERRTALVLAISVVSVTHVTHLAQQADAGLLGHVLHILGDSVLAFPLAVLAVVATRKATSILPKTLIAAGVFALTMIPASGVHALIESGSATGDHAAPAVVAGKVVAVAHSHVWSLAHAARESLFVFAIGLLAVGAAFAAALARGNRAARLDQRHRQIGRFAPRWAVAFAALASLATVVQAGPRPAVATHARFSTPLRIPPEVRSGATITMREADVQLLPGAPTKMWTYDGMFPGPTIRHTAGTPLDIRFVNNLPAAVGATTVHHHGSHSASSEDGQPSTQLIAPGAARPYTYSTFEDGAPERSAFQWYHDHRMDVTGRNVWMGLAGMVILDDALDASLNLPSGAYDVPLMIMDRSVDPATNQLSYTFNPNGKRGDHLLVNGVAQPYFEVADRKYRLRLLNASNLASQQFSIDGMTMQQIATESGLLPAPITRSTITLGPAERAEVVVDFAGKFGQQIVMRNSRGFGADLSQVMQFRVTSQAADTSVVPATLRPAPALPHPFPTNTRLWVLGQTQTGALTWTINGKGFEQDRIDAQPKINTSERWIFVNTSSVDHVVHLHDVDWRLVLRLSIDPYDDADALAEQGLKETFLVRPNEVIEVDATFTDHLGDYVFHCHLLEHEDRSMMAQFRVVA